MKTRLLLLFVLAAFGLQNCQKETPLPDSANLAVADRGTVTVPAGSNDALAAAIAQAGPGGTVILAAGEHTESGTVTIPFKLNLTGEPGAILKVATAAFTTDPVLDPALYVKNAAGAKITGIDLRTPGTDAGGTGILIEKSDRTQVEGNQISNFQIGIAVEKSDNCVLQENALAINLGWTVGAIPVAHGIIIINGKNARVFANEVSGGLFGIWACDKNGHYKDNNTHHNFIGIILCKVPEGGLKLPNGTPTGAQFSATSCKVQDNNSHDNFNTGYLVIDGSEKNNLLHNAAANNAAYDIELAGDSFRFGFLTPTSKNNLVNCGPYNVTVKDCGLSNVVIGGVHIDINVDPCF